MQELEGVNGVLQKIATRAPRISLGLLDARVGVRKYLGMGCQGQPSKWSEVQGVVHAAVEEACEHIQDVDSILAPMLRWSRPVAASPMVLPPPVAALWLKEHYGLPAVAWASHNAKRIKDLCDVAGDGRKLVPVVTIGDASWVRCMSYAQTSHFLECRVVGEGGGRMCELVIKC